jgi:hypothetical protein
MGSILQDGSAWSLSRPEVGRIRHFRTAIAI